MAKVADIVDSVRSKNAGPFWLTIDIFCSNKPSFKNLCENLHTSQLCNIFNLRIEQIQRFEINDLNVIKFSIPRPFSQGSILDRDMHGAAYAALIYELELN